MVYRIGLENYPISGLGAASSFTPPASDWAFIDSFEHGLDHPPVVRFRDRMLLDGEEQFGIIEPLIDIQKRIDETVFGMMVAQYYQAFKQRYIIGWLPESEQELLKTSASDFWTFKEPDVKVGELPGADRGGAGRRHCGGGGHVLAVAVAGHVDHVAGCDRGCAREDEPDARHPAGDAVGARAGLDGSGPGPR
jgi:hypothetical protein